MTGRWDWERVQQEMNEIHLTGLAFVKSFSLSHLRCICNVAYFTRNMDSDFLHDIVGLIGDNGDEAIEGSNEEEVDILLSELLGIDEKQQHHHSSSSEWQKNRSRRQRAPSRKATVQWKQEYQKV